jgi:RNA polymerase sigma factor (sigma-70 family)
MKKQRGGRYMIEALLVKRAQRGDVGAFVELIEKHKTALYKAAKSYLGSEEDIADAMQDTLLASYEHIGELKNTSYFKTWLTRILINQCKDILRQKKRYILSDQVEETVYEMPENDREFYELVKELPEDYRMIFLLYYGEGFKTNEIAQILDVNENTVKSRLRRGRDKLRQVLCY